MVRDEGVQLFFVVELLQQDPPGFGPAEVFRESLQLVELLPAFLFQLGEVLLDPLEADRRHCQEDLEHVQEENEQKDQQHHDGKPGDIGERVEDVHDRVPEHHAAQSDHRVLERAEVLGLVEELEGHDRNAQEEDGAGDQVVEQLARVLDQQDRNQVVLGVVVEDGPDVRAGQKQADAEQLDLPRRDEPEEEDLADARESVDHREQVVRHAQEVERAQTLQVVEDLEVLGPVLLLFVEEAVADVPAMVEVQDDQLVLPQVSEFFLGCCVTLV